MEIDSKSGQIQFKQLGGLDERSAPYAQKGTDFWLLSGLYPAEDGLLERIPGKEIILNLNGTDTGTSLQIRQIYQTNDGSGNILIQTDQDLRAYTLDYLMGRAAADGLTFTAADDDEDDCVNSALIVHREASTVAGGTLGGQDDVFYPRKLTDMLYNTSCVSGTLRKWDNGGNTVTVAVGTNLWTAAGHGLVVGDSVYVVSSNSVMPVGATSKQQCYVIASGLTANDFRMSTTPGGSSINISSIAGIGTLTYYKNANQFDLTAGTYRISAYLTFGNSTLQAEVGSRFILWNVTDNRVEYHDNDTTSIPIVSSAGFMDYDQGFANQRTRNECLRLETQFTITGTKTYEIRQAVKTNAGTLGTTTTCCGNPSSVTAGANYEYYAFIKLYKMS